ncbi:MAG: UDP-N-acetylglucosamine--LPS N-acetylglucosamine transferase [Oceanospirillaceae bacterium]|nr:UDP-N-acetylglucosamine--LPS N-acetylglucosamine transferase [Oceanospirillaceae bacterium]
MKTKKVLAVASKGGHLIQLMRLKPVLDRYDTTYVSNQKLSAVPAFVKVTDANLDSKPRLLLLFLQLLMLHLRVRPDVVISTGAAPGFFALVIGKCLGSRTIWLDSIANAEELSLSGRKVRRYADLWLTQWQDLVTEDGPEFKGRVL